MNYRENVNLVVFNDVQEMSAKMAEFLSERISLKFKKERNFNICLSGGSTPSVLYHYLCSNSSMLVDPLRIHFYWGDERCVSPDDAESNYGNACKDFLNCLNIPAENIHRIKAELPADEAISDYNSQLSSLDIENGAPVFDIIILGIGDDGHTASLFPDAMDLLSIDDWVTPARHPSSGQERISLSPKVLNNADEIVFLASGESKKQVISDIFNNTPEAFKYPAWHIRPVKGKISWFIDSLAASLII